MKALSFVATMILLGAVLLGFDLSKTAALAIQYESDQELRQEENKIILKALEAHEAKELEIFEQEARRRSDLYEFAVLFGLAVVAVAVLVPSVALAYYLVRRGNAVRASQIVPGETPSLRLLEFPSPDKRKRRQAQMSSYAWPDEAA